MGEAIAAFNQMSTRLERLEREALALKEREHLGEMGEVARGMAHALRNPLHAVGLSVDELASRLPDDPDAAGDGRVGPPADRAASTGRSGRFLALAARAAGRRGGGRHAGSSREDVVLTALQDARGRVRRRPTRPGRGRRAFARVAPELAAVVHALVVNAVEASPDGGLV